MAEIHSADLTPEARAERIRCSTIIDIHRDDLERAGLYHRLWNLINNGRDFSDPDDGNDRLKGF